MKRNKKIIFCLISFLVVVGLIGGITAYLTSRQNTDNVITVGQVKLETTETYNPPPEIAPGITFTKTPLIKNNGNMNCFVRTRILFSDESVTSYISLDINTEDWIYNETDGYYYYSPRLGVGQTAIPPFTTVSVSSTVAQDDIKAFEIFVYSEAVEAEEFTNYTDAWAYFR